MARKRHTPEQVIKKLREAEVAIAEQTFYRWHSKYGGPRIEQASHPSGQESSGLLGWGFI